VLTADTYTSVLPHTQRRAAENTARLVLRAAGQISVKILGKRPRRSGPKPGAPAQTGGTSTAPPKQQPSDARSRRRHRSKAARKRRLRRHHA
jgi:hypothetical protein